MKIAVNTRLLLHNRLEGIGWFSLETLSRICRAHPEHTFYFIFDRPYHSGFIFSDNVIPVVAGPQARHPALFYLWFEHTIPAVLKKHGCGLFLSPDGYLSLRSNVPQLAVIHDLNFEHYPHDLPWIISKYYRYYFPRFARKAVRIATVSEYSRNDIHELYNVDKDRIDVVYNGVDELYAPAGEYNCVLIRKRFTDGYPYFIFVGALLPRKNLKNLFLAYDEFRRQFSGVVKLVIAGARKWWTADMEQTLDGMDYKSDVVFTGRLEAEDLRRLTAAALAMTYVSYFEGFGIPILEAFRSGVPVITSNVTSMPEVAGDAALLSNPFQPEAIADAMLAIATDAALRRELIERGYRKAGEYSWNNTADRLWQSILKTGLIN